MTRLLHTLPTEVLDEIFEYLADDKPLLAKLAPLCRSFCQVLQPILFRKIRISFERGYRPGVRFSFDPDLRKPERSTVLLVGALDDNPLLSSFIKSLTINWSRVALVKAYVNTRDLLDRTTELSSLVLNDYPRVHSSIWADLSSNLQKLTQLTISSPETTMEDIFKYMTHESLQHLTVLKKKEELDLPKLPRGYERRTSSVANLDLGTTYHLPQASMTELIQSTRSLQSLRSTLPGITSVQLSIMVSPLSPTKITDILAPAKDSLVNLELIDTNCIWPYHDGSQIDLSDFKALVKVNVPSTCFFKCNTPGRDKNGFYRLLPRSLEDLKIMYDFEDHILPKEANADGVWETPPLTCGDCYWLEELAMFKATHFPALRSVAILERLGKISTTKHPENLALPIAVERALEEAGIVFRCVVRSDRIGVF